MKIMDFVLDTSHVFKWELDEVQKEKLKAADDLTIDDVIAVSKAGAHFMSAITKDSSWFTDENIRKLMRDTAIINNVTRKIGGQPINIELRPLK
ncbi:hypothetical protein [Chitinophaga barathri]|nr:hypothetical protein [Chitinophaga barathri]